MKKIALPILFILTAALLSSASTQTKFIQAKIGSKTYWLEIADTAAKRGQGLAKRKQLKDNQGMLFIFPKVRKHYFCMQDMRFPLDFIWIRDNKVIDITANVPNKNNGLPMFDSFTARSEFDKAIELNAGEIAKSKVKISDLVQFIGKEKSSPQE